MWQLLIASFFAGVLCVEGSVGNGQFCRGCAVLLEHAADEVRDFARHVSTKVEAGSKKKIKLDVNALIAKPMCSKPYYLGYTSSIKDACKQIIDKNFFVVGEAFRNHGQPSPDDVYGIIDWACRERMDLCDGFQDDSDYGTDPCHQCLTVVRNVQDLLTRRRDSKDYLSRKHVWGVLEDACPYMEMHHPKPYGFGLRSMCDVLMEDYDEELARVFVQHDPNDSLSPGQMICGSSTAALCKENELEGEDALEGKASPWAQLPSHEKDEL